MLCEFHHLFKFNLISIFSDAHIKCKQRRYINNNNVLDIIYYIVSP